MRKLSRTGLLTALLAVVFATLAAGANAQTTQNQPEIPLYGVRVLGDYVHMSSGDVSGHGWWKSNSIIIDEMIEDGAPPNLAETPPEARGIVSVQLEVDTGSGWKTDFASVDVQTVRKGGGRGRRATARHTCRGSENHRWRSQVGVTVYVPDGTSIKVIGRDLISTPARTLPCAP